MKRRSFSMWSGLVLTGLAFCSSSVYAADFKCEYFELPMTGDWANQKLAPNMVPPGGKAYLFASKKAGEGVLITIMPSTNSPKDAAQMMADNYRQQGMKVFAGPVQIPGQNAYRFSYVSANNKMRAINYVSGNGKVLSNISILGRNGTQGTALLRGLKSKVDGLFPKF